MVGDFMQGYDKSTMWTIKQASNLEHLAVIVEDLEMKGWTVRTVDTTEKVVLASKPKEERIDG
jgi:hypothetical protein